MSEHWPSPEVPADPIFILNPPLSLGPVVASMLGRHPELYTLPETHLFLAENIGEWFDVCRSSSFDMAHGLLRAVAQLYLDGQTEETILLSRAWLRRRTTFTTGYLLELLARKVYPRVVIERSPSIVYHISSMKRALRMFPQARFIHLLQHPRGHGEAVVAAIKNASKHGPVPQWLQHLACFSAADADQYSQERFEIDPQQAWCELNNGIDKFMEALPENQRLRVRSEDIVASPDVTLRSVLDWLGLEADDAMIDEMRHPERSPYAGFGPLGARYGDDVVFLANPVIPESPPYPLQIDGSLSWREDGEEFSSETKRAAREFGYE